jgi:hypothetical protein
LVAALNLLVAADVPAFGDDLSKATVEELIDRLTQVDAQSLGLDGFAMYSGFIAEDTPPSLEMGVLGVPPPKVSPVMRELVRRGPEALPALVVHVGDQRQTKLEVGNTVDMLADNKRKHTFLFMWMEFSDEYDPRVQEPLTGPSARSHRARLEKPFEGTYTVKVGDVCYVLIGQIVSRRLQSVRYQPTGGLVVDSPIEVSALAEKVKIDWGSVDAQGLKSSFLADMDWANRHEADSVDGEPMKYLAKDVAYSALHRLRFYFPEKYATLAGKDLKRKREFEQEELAAKSTNGPR